MAGICKVELQTCHAFLRERWQSPKLGCSMWCPFCLFIFLKFISVIFININSILALWYYVWYIYHWTMFWLINVYHILLHTQIKKINALLYFKGMYPYFKDMHSHVELDDCFLITSHILDFRQWWFTWQ